MSWAYLAHRYFIIQAGIQDRYLQNSYRHNLAFLIKFVIEGEQKYHKHCLVGFTKLVMPAQGDFIISDLYQILYALCSVGK